MTTLPGFGETLEAEKEGFEPSMHEEWNNQGFHPSSGIIKRFGADDWVPEQFGIWFVGFTEGEGCFFVGKTRCDFTIKLRADDLAILEKAQATLGVGSLRLHPKEPVGNRQPQACLNVHRKKEVLWLTEFFDRFQLQTKKARDYAIWREAVIAWYSGARDLTEYVTAIRAARAYPETVVA